MYTLHSVSASWKLPQAYVLPVPGNNQCGNMLHSIEAAVVNNFYCDCNKWMFSNPRPCNCRVTCVLTNELTAVNRSQQRLMSVKQTAYARMTARESHDSKGVTAVAYPQLLVSIDSPYCSHRRYEHTKSNGRAQRRAQVLHHCRASIHGCNQSADRARCTTVRRPRASRSAVNDG